MTNVRQTDAPVAAASPRLYRRHQRYANDNRLNHSKQELEFLNVQATRLSTTPAKIFAALDVYTADQVVAATNKSQLGIS